MTPPDQSFKRPESVLVVVYTTTGKVLLLKRADHPAFWQSMTGSMQWDERDPRDTAIRELKEETGLQVAPEGLRDLGLVQRYPILPRWRHRYAPEILENTERAYAVELPDEATITISPTEHTEYGWFSFDEAQQRVTSWTNRAAIQQVRSFTSPKNATAEREMVVLVHGLWLRGWLMMLMARRLRAAGFDAQCFSYHTVGADLHANAAALQRFLATVSNRTVHLVGHSLGNIVIRGLFHYFPNQRPGRIVMLAPPNQGSMVAKTLAKYRLGRMILGKSIMDLISGATQAWSSPAREIGIISGAVPLGVGRLIANLPSPNDGAVAVEETLLAGAQQQLTLPVAHTQMVISRDVVNAVIVFLHHGMFVSPVGQVSGR